MPDVNKKNTQIDDTELPAWKRATIPLSDKEVEGLKRNAKEMNAAVKRILEMRLKTRN